MENNKKLSDIFRDMAEIYRYLGNEERFRALAYDKASVLLLLCRMIFRFMPAKIS